MKRSNKWRYFLLAFSFTFLLLSSLAMVVVLAGQRHGPLTQPNITDQNGSTYQPDYTDRYSLVAVCLSNQGAANEFFLLQFDPEHANATLVSLPANTNISASDSATLTLAQSYQNYGAKAVLADINRYFGTDILRYVALDRQQLLTFLEAVGSVDFTLEQDIQYSDGVRDVHLRKGPQLITPQVLIDILNAPAQNQNKLQQAHLAGSLAQAYLNTSLLSKNQNGRNIFNSLVNNSENNLSILDFDTLKPIVSYIAANAQSAPVQLIQAFGSLQQNALALDESTYQQIQTLFSSQSPSSLPTSSHSSSSSP